MKIFLLTIIVLSFLLIVFFLRLTDSRCNPFTKEMIRMSSWIFMCGALLVILDISAGGSSIRRLPLDLMLSVVALSVMTSSLLDSNAVLKVTRIFLVIQIMLALYWFLTVIGLVGVVPDVLVMKIIPIAGMMQMGFYCASQWRRIRDVKAVMKSGTVWMNLSLSVDSIYVMASQIILFIYMILYSFYPDESWPAATAVILLLLETVAFGIRIINGSLFVILRRHEKRIVESMKISHVEVSNDAVQESDQYRDIYERVVSYFEELNPYLNSNLTINDVVKVVFTNKLYISRAISHYTGRNFCQFVNYHRVTYAVRLFRKNPEMKIVELASASGFNSVVSFNMAFRLFMNENPSDWCRKERVLIIKGQNKLWNR